MILAAILPALLLLNSAQARTSDSESDDMRKTCQENTAKWELVFSPTIERVKKNNPNAKKSEFIDAVLQEATSGGKVPGAQICYGTGQNILHCNHYGVLAKGSKQPVTENTLFDLASLTKPLATATLALRLREEGKLNLTDSLSRHLPLAAGTWAGGISLESLLRHRAGNRDTFPVPESDFPKIEKMKQEGVDVRAMYLDNFIKKGQQPPTDATGKFPFRYTDAAYLILGTALEQTTHTPLAELSQQKVFTPLGMTHTQYVPDLKSECARAMRVCRPHDGASHYFFDDRGGNAGLFSTAHDLSRYAQMMLNQGQTRNAQGRLTRFLSPGSIQLMTTDPSHTENLRGIGFDIQTDYTCAPRGKFSAGSFGHTGYTGTTIWMDPKLNRFVVLLTNEVDADDNKPLAQALRWTISSLVAKP